MFNKIKQLFKREDNSRLLKEQAEKQMVYDTIIAIARLSLIKPTTLVREAKNMESNADYLLKMAEELKK
jgi:hypothetical protein